MASPRGTRASPPATAGRSARRSVFAGVIVAGAAVAAACAATHIRRGGGAAPAVSPVGGDGVLQPAGRQAAGGAGGLDDPTTAAVVQSANERRVQSLPPLPLPALFDRHDGFFTLYAGKGTLHGRVLLEVPASALGVPFLVATVVTASDVQVDSPGRPLLWLGPGLAQEKVVAFRKSAGEAGALDLYRPLMDLRAEGGADANTSFPASGYWAGWLRTFPVRDVDADAYVIDVTEWVRTGLNEVTDVAFKDEDKWATVDRRFVGGAAHDRSVELDVEVRLRPKKVATALPLSPEHWVSVRVRHSLLRLPAKPMDTRPADDRIGYISTSFVATDDVSGTRAKRSYINRWDLSKGPIVFVIDPSVPTGMRSTVKAGVEGWNKAFAAAGHPDALTAVAPGDAAWPADYTIGDGRYNTVYWAPGHASSVATGTMEVDPRSGEIVRAHVVLTGAMHHNGARRLRAVVAPDVAALAANASTLAVASRAGGGDAANVSADAAPWRPIGNLTLPDVVREHVTWLTLHEVGHVLGLRHNFRGSTSVPLADYDDPAAVAADGLSSSVMDYLFHNVRAGQTVVYTPTVGRYDVAAITYGYRAFASAAERTAFARATADSGLLFCTDEDQAELTGADPYCTKFDMSAAPLTFATESVAAAVDAMRSWVAATKRVEGASWLDASAAITEAMVLASRQVQLVPKWIGGVVASRVVSDGGSGGGRPVTPIDGASQEAALEMLTAALDPVRGLYGAATAAEFGPYLLARTCGLDDTGEPYPETAGDACLGVVAAGVVATLRTYRGAVLDQLLHPARLGRLTESRAAGAADVPSVGALLRRLTETLVVAPDDDDESNDVAVDAGVQWVEALAAVVVGRADAGPAHHPAAVGAAAAELRRIQGEAAARTDDASAGLAVLLAEFRVGA